jgi:hypothetical protein
MAPMSEKLTEEQIGRYHRDGFVYPIGVFEQTSHYASAIR